MVCGFTQGGMKFSDKHKASYFLTCGINHLETNAEKKKKSMFLWHIGVFMECCAQFDKSL